MPGKKFIWAYDPNNKRYKFKIGNRYLETINNRAKGTLKES